MEGVDLAARWFPDPEQQVFDDHAMEGVSLDGGHVCAPRTSEVSSSLAPAARRTTTDAVSLGHE